MQPLGLDAPARQLWGDRTVSEIDRAVTALGGRRGSRKAESLAALLALLDDAPALRARVARADPTVAADLNRMAGVPGTIGDDEDDDTFPGELDVVGYYSYDLYDPSASQRRRETERWGLAAGLLVGDAWSGGARMPAEVALALRGPGYQAPFTPRPPDIPVGPARPEAVDSAASAAVAGFSATALTVLDRLAHEPVPRLAGGGVGVRELGRLGKRVRVDETTLRLVLERFAGGAGLVAPPGGRRRHRPVRGMAGAGAGRPDDRVAASVVALRGVPTRSRTGVDPSAWRAAPKTLPALQPEECGSCQAARIVLVATAAALPSGAPAAGADVAAAARWSPADGARAAAGRRHASVPRTGGRPRSSASLRPAR